MVLTSRVGCWPYLKGIDQAGSGLPGTNALTYFPGAGVLSIKCFITLTLKVDVVKLFLFVNKLECMVAAKRTSLV